MAWLILTIAGLLEVCWSIGLKYSDGFTKPFASTITLLAMIGSVYFLERAVQSLPIGTAYSVWVGIGATGASILGIILFKEPVTIARLIFLSMLVCSIIGLKMTSVSD